MLESNQQLLINRNRAKVAIILFFLFGIGAMCSGCLKNDITANINSLPSSSLNSLPSQLQVGPLSFEKVLQSYDWLNNKQKVIALQYLLAQNNLNDRQKAEAAYMLARLIQPLAEARTLSLFDLAQVYPPLKIKSLWHKSEIAAVLGKEKLVRQNLTALLAEIKDEPDIAAAQYALAQSYIRANETNNARDLFNKIKFDFPDTNYAIGANYYLGTLAYSQLTQNSQSPHGLPEAGLFKFNRQKPPAELLKDACVYYFEYLRASPGGHFTPDILLKLDNLAVHRFWQPKESELALMAAAYFAVGHYQSSFAYWQKAGINKHLLAASDCLLQMGQYYAAKEKFLQWLASGQKDEHCLSIANTISWHLNRSDCLHFWQQLQGSKFAFQDEALWNIAIRKSPTEAIHYYQDILTYHPQSIHAPEAQWWILWYKFKSTKINLAAALPSLFYKAAIKYNHEQLAPRFLYWAGKISEKLNNKQDANFYYQQLSKLHSASYYGQRAQARLNFLTNKVADDCFRIEYSPNNTADKSTANDQLEGRTVSAATVWNCPPPEKAIDYELIYIKQYAEALIDSHSLPPELAAWLEGKCGQPWLAINTACQCLKERGCPISEPLLWQYSFPRLYAQEIVVDCRKTKIVDPMLVQALVREESRYNPEAISQAHALGLCQLMPATATSIARNAGINITSKAQLFQPNLNLFLGISYLSSALQTFNNNGLPAIASYNAGIGAVKNFLGTKQINFDPDQFVEDFPFRETRDYMRKVFASYWHYKKIYL